LLRTLNYEVLVNVASARKASSINILDCSVLQKRIDSLQGKTHLIKCTLSSSAPRHTQ
jgi:hypothetical protein